ncbi:hypothetical protein [Microviridae sp.]|nr:hypothetical protein [Microviridae sp.]
MPALPHQSSTYVECSSNVRVDGCRVRFVRDSDLFGFVVAC